MRSTVAFVFLPKRIVRLLFLITAGAVALILVGCPARPALSPGVVLIPDQIYADGYVESEYHEGESYVLRPLFYDRYYSTDFSGQIKPAVLMVHGGGFVQGSKSDEKQVQLADFLSTQGFVCFLIEYRLRDDNPPAPSPYDEDPILAAAHASMVDTKAAIRFIRANAEEFEVHPDYIAVLGASAGAIAALTAGLSPPHDFAADSPAFPIPENNYPEVNPVPRVVVNLWGSADHLLHYLNPESPPIFIAHGMLDESEGTPFEAAVRLAEACETQQVPYTFYAFPEFAHGAWQGQMEGVPLRKLILDFLNTWLR